MRTTKIVIAAIAFLAVCVGCYYISEARHDYDLHESNAELEKKLEAEQSLREQLAEDVQKVNQRFLDAICVRWPENADEYKKMYKTSEDQLKKEKEAESTDEGGPSKIIEEK